MLNLIKTFLLASTVAIVSGCATAPSGPVKMNANKSRALNIAEAGGIFKGVKDSKIPKDTTGALTDSAIYQSMYAGLGFVNPGSGLTNMQGLGLGILAGVFEPDSPGARNSLMAWMPVGLAKDEESAQRLMSSMVVQATADALQHLKYPITDFHKSKTTSDVASVHISQTYPGCEKSACMVYIYTPKPSRHSSPEFVSNGAMSYEFPANASHKYFHATMNFPKQANINTLEIYQEMSKRLPEWVFSYVSPARTYQANGEKTKAPIIFQAGNPHLFVVSE